MSCEKDFETQEKATEEYVMVTIDQTDLTLVSTVITQQNTEAIGESFNKVDTTATDPFGDDVDSGGNSSDESKTEQGNISTDPLAKADTKAPLIGDDVDSEGKSSDESKTDQGNISSDPLAKADTKAPLFGDDVDSEGKSSDESKTDQGNISSDPLAKADTKAPLFGDDVDSEGKSSDESKTDQGNISSDPLAKADTKAPLFGDDVDSEGKSSDESKTDQGNISTDPLAKADTKAPLFGDDVDSEGKSSDESKTDQGNISTDPLAKADTKAPLFGDDVDSEGKSSDESKTDQGNISSDPLAKADTKAPLFGDDVDSEGKSSDESKTDQGNISTDPLAKADTKAPLFGDDVDSEGKSSDESKTDQGNISTDPLAKADTKAPLFGDDVDSEGKSSDESKTDQGNISTDPLAKADTKAPLFGDDVDSEGKSSDESKTEQGNISTDPLAKADTKAPLFGDDVDSEGKSSDESKTEQGEENLLRDKLLALTLNQEEIEFLLEEGDKFIEKSPLLLARRLNKHVEKVKLIIEALKFFKNQQAKNISEHDMNKIEECLTDNPEFSTPDDIALISGIALHIVVRYLRDRPLDDKQKTEIREKFNTGYSMNHIVMILGLQEIKVKDYLESTFLTFTCKDGRECLRIIQSNCTCPIFELRRLIIHNNLKLQDQLGCILQKQNTKEYFKLKQYFEKFEESRSFFHFNAELTMDDIILIKENSLSDIEHLSTKLNKVESAIREYLEQYHPNQVVRDSNSQLQKVRIQQFLADFEDNQLTFHSYRMIISDSFEEMIRNAQITQNQKKVFLDLLPLAFYYLKCSLPFNDLTQIIANSCNVKLTTHDLFHLIFQLSDPVLKGFCIEHYSFSNPVPFYFPKLRSTHEQTQADFAICKELWYSVQQFNGLVSFGLGRAGWNPIGKSHLLDLIFETDFVQGNPHNSAFHFNSIDIQMTKNHFGEMKEKSNAESIKWAYIDCNGHSNKDIIKIICQHLDIALIQVTNHDYENNNPLLKEDIYKLTNSVKHVYLLIRDYGGKVVKVEVKKNKDKVIKYIFIPNLTKPATNFNSVIKSLKDIGYEILHLTSENSKTIGSEFLENLLKDLDPSSFKEIMLEKGLIEKITGCVSKSVKSSRKIDFSFLQFYPLFVDYMSCYYRASYETNHHKIEELNDQSKRLNWKLYETNMGNIVKHFNEIICRENSTLIMWKLSQHLSLLSKQINYDEGKIIEQKNDKYTIEILWREALLSSKYYSPKDNGEERYIQRFASSYSNHVERGEPFELIDGDNLRFFNTEIDKLLSSMYKRQFENLKLINKDLKFSMKQAPIVVSIVGPQSSGKSTLLNYCFGCKFLTSAARCTRGIYASLSKLSSSVNLTNQFLILDTEGLDAIERGNIKDTSLIHFDRTMVLFCLAVSQVVIINVRGDIGVEMQNLLQICAYSLNKLKVRKVAAPQIFFVLNQQADPDPDKHLDSINILMEKLNRESEFINTDGTKISDLIKISRKNLFVLPSAFNSEQINKPGLNLFDSKIIKLSPTITFADKCADLRFAIINQLCNMSLDERSSFQTMSEWMEMSGTIWDTIIRYQDIVKYRNVEEIICSNLLKKIISELMDTLIYCHRQKYLEMTEKLSSRIQTIDILNNPDEILTKIRVEFNEFFQTDTNLCLMEYSNRCNDEISLKMIHLIDESKLNLSRLIYMEKKIYEDKLLFQISAVLIEKKLSESTGKFQEAIIKNVDNYLGSNVEEQTQAFQETWIQCFGCEDKIEEVKERDENFHNLYSLFSMESITMENSSVILKTFYERNFIMENIINFIKDTILTGFLQDSSTVDGMKQFIFHCKGNNTPIKDMTPFPGKSSYDYLAKDSLFTIDDTHSFYLFKAKTKLRRRELVPKPCKPLLKYCSGYYNHPDIVWKEWPENRQILFLAANLKSPRGCKNSTWEFLIEDISMNIQYYVGIDPNVSPATVKGIVYFLCYTFNVVNYEINFIQAKLTNTAERTLSTLAFAYAFKSLWDTKTSKRLENKLKTEKEKKNLLQYFLQKIEIRKMVREGWDREKMKNSDHKISHIFAFDLIGRVKRGVVTTEQPIIENLFSERKGELTHRSIFLCAKTRLSKELETNPEEEIFGESNFVVQYICNRNEILRSIFFEKWANVAEELYHEVIPEISKKITNQIKVIKKVLNTLLDDLETCIKGGSSEHKAFDSDSNFEITDMDKMDSESGSEVKVKESPFKAMVLYLRMYLDPKVTPGEFRNFFKNEFEVDGVKMKISDTYKLCQKPINPTHILDEEIFKKLEYTKMFTCENIFNITEYVTEFRSVLNSFKFELTTEEFNELIQPIKDKFERDVIGCPNQCPSCGKLCERELHPNDGKCQIKTGHQICSMGGKVWNDKNRTAVLFMCDDYQDNANVVLQGRTMTWGQFKMMWENQWDWKMPNDKNYVDLQNNNRDTMINIWNKFGKGILNYYSTRGTKITFVPYDFHKSLTIKYYICFVIDGTVSMATEIKKVRISVGQFMDKYKECAFNSEFKIVIYRDHCDNKVIEKYPCNDKFTPQHKEVQEFLSTVKAMGGGDYPEAVLDGLATATTECDWKTSQGVKNIIIHIFDAPPHGDFPHHTVHQSKSNRKHCCCCNQGTLCPFDWDRDVWDNIITFNIQYNGINTGKKFPEFEAAMKQNLGELCGDFQTVGQEVVNEAILQIFIQNKID